MSGNILMYCLISKTAMISKNHMSNTALDYMKYLKIAKRPAMADTLKSEVAPLATTAAVVAAAVVAVPHVVPS